MNNSKSFIGGNLNNFKKSLENNKFNVIEFTNKEENIPCEKQNNGNLCVNHNVNISGLLL
jgi:hypothetical protein